MNFRNSDVGRIGPWSSVHSRRLMSDRFRVPILSPHTTILVATVCLNACFTSDHQTFAAYLFKVGHVMGAIIMTPIEHMKKVF